MLRSEIVFNNEAIDDPQQRKPDISKAEKYLGWKPKISFNKLIKEMVLEDLKKAQREKLVIDKGFDN